jgi:hypothetical protein
VAIEIRRSPEMGDTFPPLDLLAKAAKDRRDARRALRDNAKAVAAKIAQHLRSGDEVDVDGIVYEVVNVTWWLATPDDPHDYYALCQKPEGALIRHEGNRRIALSDPRRTYEDEDGIRYRPADDAIFDADILDAGITVFDTYRIPNASEAELIAFADESPRVIAEFVRVVAMHAATLEAAAKRLSNGAADA